MPVVAVPTEVDEHGGLVTDTRSDMGGDLDRAGRPGALPMFTSLESLDWDPAARPVPVRAAAAAQAAITESCDVLLVDVSSPHATVLRSMLWALAQERAWVPAHRDEHVARAVRMAVAEEPLVTGHRVEAGQPAGAGVLRVVLLLPQSRRGRRERGRHPDRRADCDGRRDPCEDRFADVRPGSRHLTRGPTSSRRPP